jgi:hypothetical protein
MLIRLPTIESKSCYLTPKLFSPLVTKSYPCFLALACSVGSEFGCCRAGTGATMVSREEPVAEGMDHAASIRSRHAMNSA